MRCLEKQSQALLAAKGASIIYLSNFGSNVTQTISALTLLVG